MFKHYLAKYLIENVSKKSYQGNCINSFDDDGDCTIPHIPYRDATDFAQAEENYKPITKDTFLTHVHTPMFNINKHDFFHDEDNDMFVSYDNKKDVHYFYN